MTNAPNVNELVNEVAGSNFADDRLTRRLRNLVGSLAVAPKKSLPKALDEASLEGAYRFMSNPRVTPEQILSGHWDGTVARCEHEQTVLIAHDSTSFSYRYDGEREGLGRVQRGNEKSKLPLATLMEPPIFRMMEPGGGTQRPKEVVSRLRSGVERG